MRIGLFQTAQWPAGTAQRDRYREMMEQCVAAEALGYASVWLTEHHFTRHGITSDSIALLAHLAARTERIRLGTAVAVLPFHDPVRLAESTALVDHLSGGRLDVGIGRGYQWSEYNGFGIKFDEGSDRFEEALDVLLRSWTATEPFAFAGTFHSYEAAFPQPSPLQRPHPPLWHATTGDAGLRRCAENGWGVMLAQATPLAAVDDVVTRFRAHALACGADPPSDRLVVARGMYCAESSETAQQHFLGPYVQFLEQAARVSAPPDRSEGPAPRNPFEIDDETGLLDTAICGDPEQCGAQLRALQERGIEHVLLFVNLAGIDHQATMASLRLFATEVLTRFT